MESTRVRIHLFIMDLDSANGIQGRQYSYNYNSNYNMHYNMHYSSQSFSAEAHRLRFSGTSAKKGGDSWKSGGDQGSNSPQMLRNQSFGGFWHPISPAPQLLQYC